VAALRKIPGDWYDGVIPENVLADPEAHIDSSYSFIRFRSRLSPGLTLGRGAAVYKNTRFDVGPDGGIEIGEFALINGAEMVCDSRIRIGAYALISWSVILLDNYRVPRESNERCAHLQNFLTSGLDPHADHDAKPIEIGRNVWLGHDVVVMPGACIGEGSVIGARSAVVGSIPPYTIAAGNPARVIRELPRE
jgi:acetyltransferase-like isoleucine patch superfamily enzyme